MAKKKKIISMPRGAIGRICNDFGCKKTTVYSALSYDIDSELAQKIRKDAVEIYGGVETTKIVF